jgi:hypothetical protein
MIRISPLLSLSATLLLCLIASSAQAQVTRTFVSGTGTANSSCSYTAPCRFFTQAIAALPAGGGEVDVLDPGSYGQVTITNSVSLIGRGWTTITATGSTAGINITGSGTVNINGVQLDGGGSGLIGISQTGSGTLNIQNSLIRNFANAAISIAPNASLKLFISDTLVADSLTGIGFSGTNDLRIDAELDHVRSEGNTQSGLLYSAAGFGSITISNSVFSKNASPSSHGCGINNSPSISSLDGAIMTIVDTTIANNWNGTCADAAGGQIMIRNSTITGAINAGVEATGTGALTTISHSMFIGNERGVSASSGAIIYSWGDNMFYANAGDGTTTPTTNPYK